MPSRFASREAITSSIALVYCSSVRVWPSGAANTMVTPVASTGLRTSGKFSCSSSTAFSEGVPGMANWSLNPRWRDVCAAQTATKISSQATITIHFHRKDQRPSLNSNWATTLPSTPRRNYQQVLQCT